MEQMMAHLLAEIRTNREAMREEIKINQGELKAMQQKMDANQKEMKENIKINQAKADANLKEIRAIQEHRKEEMMAGMDSKLENMDACLGRTETTDQEANPEEKEYEAEHEEVPKEEAAVKTVGALKKRLGIGILL
jgi:hypothetical protein